MDKPLRERYANMRRKIRKRRHWEKNCHEIFRLNTFPNEFAADPESVIIDHEFDRIISIVFVYEIIFFFYWI